MVKAIVLTGFGINCEEEMAAAYKLAGAEATIVHLNELLSGQYQLDDYDVLNFPGGFSFGDDLSSGKVLANKIKYRKLENGKTLLEEINAFIKKGKFVLGVCNGFQILVRMGLLPNTAGYFEQEATLMENDSGKFEDRWVYCKVTEGHNTPFLKNMDVIPLPVRHGEGKLVINSEAMEATISGQKLNCLTYCLEDGSPVSAYPANPNGSDLNCAGLCDPTGQVFGLMPHPEAFLSLYNHPNWGLLKRQNPAIAEEGMGLKIFTNIVEHIEGNGA